MAAKTLEMLDNGPVNGVFKIVIFAISSSSIILESELEFGILSCVFLIVVF